MLDQRSRELPTFEAAYLAHRVFVERVARRSGIPDFQIDDVCQEVFMIVYRKLPTFEGRARLSTWIYCIARNVVSNNRRSRSKRPLLGYYEDPPIELDELPEDGVDAEESLVRRELIRLAYFRLRALSLKKQTAFVLSDLEGYTVKETVRLTECCPDTIRSRVRAVRQELKLFSARLNRFQDAQSPSSGATTIGASSRISSPRPLT